jgi:solute carrier family 25, member 38
MNTTSLSHARLIDVSVRHPLVSMASSAVTAAPTLAGAAVASAVAPLPQVKDAVKTQQRSKKLAAGALSGMLSALAFQPLDVLRTHQQGAFGSNKPAPSVVEVLTKQAPLIDRLRSLWRGTSATLIRVAGGAGLYFATLDQCLASVPNTSLNTFLSGAFARTFAGSIVSPLTIIKARMEWQPAGTYASNMDVLRHVLRDEGVRGLYRGMLPTLARDVPFSGLYVLIYKRLQRSVEERATDLPPYAINFGSGVVAGVLATTVVHPADVVKTRMQLTIVQTSTAGELLAVKNSLSLQDTLAKIWHDEGPLGFAKGIVPRVLKRTLSTAVTWTIYEQLSVVR